MSDNLILDFPVLKPSGIDFAEGVSYEVGARQSDGKLTTDGKLTITHTLKGRSFIQQLIKDGDAKFSVLLLYKDSSERQTYQCPHDEISIKDDSSIVATQIVPRDFSYAPEIMASIIILKEKDISADASSGLTDFWKHGVYKIPQYSRIALAPKLKFTRGGVSNLIEVNHAKSLDLGEMKVRVNEQAGEGKKPVSLWCGKDVYDELHKVPGGSQGPHDPVESMRWAIITQALCAVYAYMQNVKNLNPAYEASGVLLDHLELLREKTDEDWEDPDFNPSLAATKMHPYVILSDEVDDN
ncbi:MAG: hypothetical protein OXU40_06200 [Nitrospira sp.]|nr:hypothetical protein [Nitrospira sp.]